AAGLAPFRRPLRWVGRSAAGAGLALAALAIDIQILHADDFLVRPQLGVQADGVRRHAYTPRVLDVARQIPRGTIFDRRGLPLATDDVTVMEGARAEYQKLGISLADVWASATERCYPLAGRAFHVLGDVSRVNWSAPNTSYVERDAD